MGMRDRTSYLLTDLTGGMIGIIGNAPRETPQKHWVRNMPTRSSAIIEITALIWAEISIIFSFSVLFSLHMEGSTRFFILVILVTFVMCRHHFLESGSGNIKRLRKLLWSDHLTTDFMIQQMVDSGTVDRNKAFDDAEADIESWFSTEKSKFNPDRGSYPLSLLILPFICFLYVALGFALSYPIAKIAPEVSQMLSW